MTKRTVFNGVDRPRLWKSALSGKRVGLVTNPSGVDRNLRLTSDVLYESGCLVALFSPEHGVRGDRQAGDHVDTYTDEKNISSRLQPLRRLSQYKRRGNEHS